MDVVVTQTRQAAHICLYRWYTRCCRNTYYRERHRTPTKLQHLLNKQLDKSITQ